MLHLAQQSKPSPIPEEAREALQNDISIYLESLYPVILEIWGDLHQILAHMNIDVGSASATKAGKGTLFLKYMNEEQRSLLKIDDVLALYLIDVSTFTKVNFYKMVTCLV